MPTCPNCGSSVETPEAVCEVCGHSMREGDTTPLSEETNTDVSDSSVTDVISLPDPEEIRDRPDLPSLDLAGPVTIEAGQLANLLSKVDDRGAQSVRLTIRPEEPPVVVEGNQADVHFELDVPVESTPASPTSSIYDREWLQTLLTNMPRSARLHLDIGDELPLKLRRTFADGDGRSEYMLAPELES